MLTPSPSMCFVIEDQKDDVTQSGIVLALQNKSKNSHGTIYAINTTVVCPHCIQVFNRTDLAAGDKVIYSRYVAEQIDVEGEEFTGKKVFVLPIDSILAKIHD